MKLIRCGTVVLVLALIFSVAPNSAQQHPNNERAPGKPPGTIEHSHTLSPASQASAYDSPSTWGLTRPRLYAYACSAGSPPKEHFVNNPG